MSSSNNLVVNPQTGRPVKVGSRTWIKLVNDGLIESDYNDPNELYEIQDVDEKDDINKMKRELNEGLGPSSQAVLGRGKYKNKLVKRTKTPSKKETINFTAKVATKRMKEIPQDQDLDDDEIADILSKMIAEEMMISHTRTKPKAIPKRPATPIPYEEEETEEEDEEEYYE